MTCTSLSEAFSTEIKIQLTARWKYAKIAMTEDIYTLNPL
jgi:hypothetical protein